MQAVTTICLDIAKSVFQFHGRNIRACGETSNRSSRNPRETGLVSSHCSGEKPPRHIDGAVTFTLKT